jgi:hypothetical protein
MSITKNTIPDLKQENFDSQVSVDCGATPTSDSVKIDYELIFPISENKVVPLAGDDGPTTNCASLRLNPPVTPGIFWLRVKLVRLNEPEPFHTTLGPTCETVIIKLADDADVGVGVFVGVTVGVVVEVGVGDGQTISYVHVLL